MSDSKFQGGPCGGSTCTLPPHSYNGRSGKHRQAPEQPTDSHDGGSGTHRQAPEQPTDPHDGGSGTHRQAPEQPTDSHDGGSGTHRQAPEQPTDPHDGGSGTHRQALEQPTDLISTEDQQLLKKRESAGSPILVPTTATISTKTRKATGPMPKWSKDLFADNMSAVYNVCN